MHTSRVRWVITIGIAAVAVVALAIWIVAPRTDNRQTFALDSNGWSPGETSRGAAAAGPFHAVKVVGGACAWIGDHRRPTLWPKGWTVRFDPTELLDANATIVAREGDMITASSSTAADRQPIPDACATTSRDLRSVTEIKRR